MDKVEGQLSPSYEHFLIPQTTKWNEWFWIFAFLAAGTLVVAAVNLRGVLKGARWRPHKGCGKGLIQAKPRSHYVLPSGDKIPSMALGRATPSFRSVHCSTDFFLFTCASGVGNAGKGEVGQAVKAALAAGYRHIDGAWAYPVRTLVFPAWMHQSNKTSAHRMSKRLEMRLRRAGFPGKTSSSHRRHVGFWGVTCLIPNHQRL